MKKKLFAGVIGTTLMLGIGTGAIAASTMEEIKAFLNGEIKFLVNGSDWKPTDEQGNELKPITYNGSTYVPLRAISNALKTPVDYNAETKTVILGEKADGMNLFSESVKYKQVFGGDAEEVTDVTLGGKKFKGAYKQKLDIRGDAVLIEKIDLGKPFSKMKAILGAQGDAISVKVVDDKGQTIKEISLEKDEVKEVEIELGGSQKPKFLATGKGKSKGYFYLFKESTVK